MPKRTSGQRQKFNSPVEQADGSLCFNHDDYYIRTLSLEGESIIWDYDLVDYEDNCGETKILGVSLEQCITIITAELEEVVKSISNENTISDDSYVMFAPDFSLKRSVPSSLAELKDRFDSLKIYG